jgi:ribonucleoside-diphosphate reductase alpha chain
LTVFLKSAGIPNEPDSTSPDNVTVFSFPVAAPDGSVTTKELGVRRHFNLWFDVATDYCDHNASVTFHVREDEWLWLFASIYKEWDAVIGVTMLPYDDHVYVQAPYEEITKEEYDKMVAEFPAIDWAGLREIETEDGTRGTRDLACSAGVCEIVDLV